MGSCINLNRERQPVIPELLTYAPDKSYKFSERYDLYVRDLKKLPNIPPPQPNFRLKKDVIDINEYILVDDRAVRVPDETLSKPLEALVQYLTLDYDDDMSKVRVLYRWLTNQPLLKMTNLEKKPKSNTALFQLWKLRNKHQRYSKVFSLLCRYAGLPCVTIHGAIKGTYYDIGDAIDLKRHYGEWNAVLVDGGWRLVDALWGACEAKDPGDGSGRYTCDDNFFLVDSKDLIFTHFAASPRWQLLEPPKTIQGFEETACLKNRFFDLGMQILSHPLCEIHAPEGEIDILFGLSPKKARGQKFNCYISHFNRPETKRYLTRGSNNRAPVFIHRLTESSISVKVRFPENGVFRLEIVGKQLDRTNVYREFDWVAIYKVTVDVPAERGFPKTEAIGWGPTKEMNKIGLTAFNYTSGIIVAKSIQTKIRFKILDTVLVQNMKFFFKISSTYETDFPVNTVNDRFEVDLNIMTFYIDVPPFGEYTLKMFAKNVRGNVGEATSQEMNVCNYLLISDAFVEDPQLGVLVEKTEIFDDSPDIPPLNLRHTPENRPAETGGSVVSASNVIMEPIPTTTTRVSSASVNREQNFHRPPPISVPPQPASPVYQQQAIPQRPPQQQPAVKIPRLELNSVERPRRREPSPDEVSIMEIPLVNTKPRDQPPPPRREKSIEKRDSRKNKVMPFSEKGAGGDDPPQKPSRPGSSVTRRRSSDDMTFFKALNVVRKKLQ